MMIYRMILLLMLSQQVFAQPRMRTAKADSGNLPFELIKNKIIIPVTIDGVTYRFLLDTGGIFGVSAKVKSTHQLESGITKAISDINKNELEIPTVIVPKISIGHLDFVERIAVVEDLVTTYPYSCFEVDGMIGRDFFEGLILSFDLAQGWCRLSNDEADFDLSSEHKTAMRLSKRGLPDVLLRIDGKEEYIEFDAGSGDFFSYQTKVAKKLKRQNKQDKLCFEGIFSFGITMDAIKTTKRYAIKIKELVIANQRFENFYSDLSKLTAPRIGADILNYGQVIVDYKHQDFYFIPYTEKEKAQGFTTFGFDIARVNDNYIVKWVLQNSEAAQKGLCSGNRVIAINGIPIAEIAQGCQGYLQGYSFHDLASIKLQLVQTKGKPKILHLKKMNL